MRRIKNYFLCIKYPFLRVITGKAITRYQNYLEWKLKAEKALDCGNIRKYMWCILIYYIKAWIFVLFSWPEFTFYDDIPTGWKKAFGKKMLNEIRKQCKKEGSLYEFRIMEIKEKYGQLRIQCNYASKELYDILFKYESLSWSYCIKCGKPTKYISLGYVCPYCEKCKPENTITLEEYMNNLNVD